MKCKYSIITGLVALSAMLFSLTGCEKWLDIKPSNEQDSKSFWSTKEEVQSVTISGYVSLRNSIERMFQWGDLRSDLVTLGTAKTTIQDFVDLKALEVPTSPTEGDFLSWVDLYATISRANSVIKFAPGVCEVDKTFTVKECEALVAEAIWERSLAYFYLVRAFNDVPYITEPYLDDSQDFRSPATPGAEILKHVIADLEANEKKIPTQYASALSSSAWQNKGRATRLSYAALMADIYMWQGNYTKAIEKCNFIIAVSVNDKNMLNLLDATELTNMFYNKNNSESIFELQFDGVNYSQKNGLNDMFISNSSGRYSYMSSPELVNLFNKPINQGDIRGESYSYSKSSPNLIYKYRLRSSVSNDANWIIYRLADIMLLKAEAWFMANPDNGTPYSNDPDQNGNPKCVGYELVKQIRERAGRTAMPDLPATQIDGLQMVLEERALELCFEGKRWFDLVRMAMRGGDYTDKVIDIMVASVPASKRELYVYKLKNNAPYGFFFPIHEDEIENSGGLLKQNPYYE